MTDVVTILPPINAGFTKSTSEFNVYKKRWVILFIYTISTMANGVLFACITAIDNVAAKYWNVSHVVIEWIPNTFILVYIVIALPCAYFISSFGLRASMIAATSLNAISGSLHYAGQTHDQFVFVLAGHVAASLGIGILAVLPAHISTIWFPEHEHAKATSIGIFMNLFGLALAFLQSTHMVPNSDNLTEVHRGIFEMFLSHVIFVCVCLILVCILFDDAPPTPPSIAAAILKRKQYKMSYMKSLQKLVVDRDYHFFAHAYGIYMGMFLFFTIVLNQLVSEQVKNTSIGWMGFTANCLGILGIMAAAQVIDSFHCYRFLSTGVIFCSLASWIVFTMLLLHKCSEYGIFAAYSFVGFFGLSYFSIGAEQAAMMTYPVPETISCGVALQLGNVYGFLFILVFGNMIEKGMMAIVLYVTIALYLISFVFALFSKTSLRRQSINDLLSEDETRNEN